MTTTNTPGQDHEAQEGRMSDNVNVRVKAAAMLAAHEVVYVDDEIGYACGCDEEGVLALPTLANALAHQADALAAEGLLRDGEEAQARARGAGKSPQVVSREWSAALAESIRQRRRADTAEREAQALRERVLALTETASTLCVVRRGAGRLHGAVAVDDLRAVLGDDQAPETCGEQFYEADSQWSVPRSCALPPGHGGEHARKAPEPQPEGGERCGCVCHTIAGRPGWLNGCLPCCIVRADQEGA